MARYAVSLQVGLTILAVLLLLLLQGILILLALSDAQLGGGAAAAVGVDNYWAMVRSFEFRRALANTLWVLAMALVIIVPALGIVMRLGEQSRRLRVLVLVAVIVPLAMPGALGALAWRSTLEVLHIPLDRRWVALPVFALVQAWRAFPLAVAVRTAPLRQHQRTRAGLAGAVAAYWIVADVSVVMLLTGGAPANATHVLASWGYVTAVTGGQIGLGAAMEMTLLVVLRLLGIALGWLGVQLLLQRADGVTPPAPASADLAASRPPWRAWTALTVLLLWLLTPLLVVVIQAGWPWAWGAPLRVLIATSGYVWWLGGTLLLAAGAVLVTVWAAPPAAQWLVRRSLNMRKAAGSGVLALVLTSLPVAFVPLLWVDDRLRLVPALAELALLYIFAALCLGVGFAALAQARLQLDRRGLIAALALIALFVITQEFSNALALDVGRAQTLNSGLVNHLAFRADIAPATTALAVLLPTLLFGALFGSLVWVIHKRRARGTEIPFGEE